MGRQIVVSGAKVDKRVNQPRESEPESTPQETQPETGTNPESTI
jgi:hypothetical protein